MSVKAMPTCGILWTLKSAVSLDLFEHGIVM